MDTTKLTHKQRQVFRLRYTNGWRLTQIAAEVGTTRRLRAASARPSAPWIPTAGPGPCLAAQATVRTAQTALSVATSEGGAGWVVTAGFSRIRCAEC